MSKCQIGKYRPGGRCAGAAAEAGVKKDAGSLGSAYAALMAARERLDTSVLAPAHAEQVQPQVKTDAITLFTQGNKSAQRKADIDLILKDCA